MIGHVREEIGAYVLGALEPPDHERVRSHLATCAACREESERLAGLPALLDLLPANASALPAAPPPDMEDTVLAALSRERRHGRHARLRRLRGRPALALGSAVAGAAAAVIVLGSFGALSREAEPTRSVELTAPQTGARATATLRPTPGGTSVALQIRDLPSARSGEVYEVWFVRREGRVSAGTFSVRGTSDTKVELTTAARPGEYERIGITREPNGLDPARNGPNVLAGRLPL